MQAALAVQAALILGSEGLKCQRLACVQLKHHGPKGSCRMAGWDAAVTWSYTFGGWRRKETGRGAAQ